MKNYSCHKVPNFYNFSKFLVFLLIPWNYGSQPYTSLSVLSRFAWAIVDQPSGVFKRMGDQRTLGRIKRAVYTIQGGRPYFSYMPSRQD